MQELTEKRFALSQAIKARRDYGIKLANAEFEYKKGQSKMIATLNIMGHVAEEGKMKPVAITACETMSHGVEPVASLRLQRDIAKIEYECEENKIYQANLEIKIIENQIAAERRGV